MHIHPIFNNALLRNCDVIPVQPTSHILDRMFTGELVGYYLSRVKHTCNICFSDIAANSTDNPLKACLRFSRMSLPPVAQADITEESLPRDLN